MNHATYTLMPPGGRGHAFGRHGLCLPEALLGMPPRGIAYASQRHCLCLPEALPMPPIISVFVLAHTTCDAGFYLRGTHHSHIVGAGSFLLFIAYYVLLQSSPYYLLSIMYHLLFIIFTIIIIDIVNIDIINIVCS